MTAIDFDRVGGDHAIDLTDEATEWSPNLMLEYAMIAFGALLVLAAIVAGFVTMR